MSNSTWDFRSNKQKYENMLLPGSTIGPKAVGLNTARAISNAARKEGKSPKMVI